MFGRSNLFPTSIREHQADVLRQSQYTTDEAIGLYAQASPQEEQRSLNPSCCSSGQPHLRLLMFPRRPERGQAIRLSLSVWHGASVGASLAICMRSQHTSTGDSHVSSDSDVTHCCVPATRGFAITCILDDTFRFTTLLIHARVHNVRGVLTKEFL